MFKLFKNKMQQHMEKKSKYENEIKLLKGKRQAEYENTITLYKNKKVAYKNDVVNQLDNLNSQIKVLKEFESEQLKAYDKEMNIRLQQIDNKFNAKILNLTNELTTLTNLIEKEEKDLKDLIEPLKAATSGQKKILIESAPVYVPPIEEITQPKKKSSSSKKGGKKTTKKK